VTTLIPFKILNKVKTCRLFSLLNGVTIVLFC